MSIRALVFLWFALVAALPAGAWFERIETGRPVEIYAQSETPGWRIVLRNSLAQPLVGATLVWQVSGWGKPGVDASTLPVPELAPGASHELSVTLRPELLGWHEVAFELRGADGVLLGRHARLLSVGETPRSTGGHFLYGLCSHMIRHVGSASFDLELELTRRLGVDTIRTELAGWESTEPTEGRFDFSKPDTLLAALEPHGVKVEAIFAYSTRWGSTGDANAKDWNEWNKTAPRLDPWLNYVGRTVDRYKDRVSDWEIWNEPDISFWRASTAQYIELFDASSALIKKKSPRARVLNGGLAMVSRVPNPDFVARFIASASPTNWDVFAYHDYHSFAQFQARRAEVKTHQDALNKTLPLWINEGGSHSLFAGGERAQALTLVKKIASAPAFGIGAYFWYNLRDDGLDPKDPEHHFGLVRHDGQPKPAWSAYQALIRELGDSRYLRSLPAAETPAGTWAHLYERSGGSSGADRGTHVLVLWQEGADRRIPHWLGVGEGARVLRVTDLMGNPLDAAAAGQGVALKLGEVPIYVHISASRGSAPQPRLRPIIETAPRVVLLPGRSTDVALRIHNPFDRQTMVKLGWESSVPGLSIAPAETEATIAPGASIDLSTTVKPPGEPLARDGAPGLDVTLTMPESGLTLSARIPVSVALPIPSLDRESAVPPTTVRLDRRDDIHNLYSAEPLPHMQWRGPDDLSATARFTCDRSDLHLLVEVRDDIHRQADIKDKVWAADSLQVGLRLDETRAEYVEIGLGLADDGRVGGWVFATDSAIPLARGRLSSPIRSEVTRDEAAKTTRYRLRLPWSELDRDGPPSTGFHLSFIVNDDDGHGRKQWVKLTDGLGEQKTPDLWQIFICP